MPTFKDIEKTTAFQALHEPGMHYSHLKLSGLYCLDNSVKFMNGGTMFNSRNIILSICSFMLIVLAPLTTQAQVDFDVSASGEGLASDIRFWHLDDDEETVVEFLYLTAKDDFCSSNVTGSKDFNAIVCVFDDPTDPDSKHLYVDIPWSWYFVVLYEGSVAAVVKDEEGLGSLPDGDYSLLLFRESLRSHIPVATVSFSISDDADTPASVPVIAESITLDTPEPGTTWQKAEKHGMKSGCNVAYGLIDFDTSAIVVVLKGETTIREVTSTELYGKHETALTPAQEEEGDWEGWLGVISLYLDPLHLLRYQLHYEHGGKTYEVNFVYESGITGSRDVAAAIIIEC